MIKNQELTKQILEMMNTALEASEEMMKYLHEEKLLEFEEISEGLCLMIQSINNIADGLQQEEPTLNLPAASKSVLVSALRVQKIAKENIARACHKLEFELIPLIEEMRVSFFYWGTAYPDPEKIKKYNEEDIYRLTGNKYIEEAEKTGTYKYDLSISVLGYNKMEYTVQCLESLYSHLPKDISYEIILINHGSTDGTKALYEGYKPDKQLDIAVNGGGLSACNRIAEGKYRLGISNDVIVTQNAIDNLYKCIISDEKIDCSVPATANVSNFQSLPAEYTDNEGLKRFVEKNNISNPTRWEQRNRLCDPIAMMNAAKFNRLRMYWRYSSSNEQSLPDDRTSLLLRRNGYKMFLVKDAYCHHFGSVTLNEEQQTYSKMALQKGKEIFEQTFGVTPWSTGFCYSKQLFSELKCEKQGDVHVLGINCGFGANYLKIKESLKENVSNFNVRLKNITTNPAYLEDLKGVSDEAEYIDELFAVKETAGKYDYIVAEDVCYTEETIWDTIDLFAGWSKEDGRIAILLEKKLIPNIQNENEKQSNFRNIKGVLEGNGKYWLVFSK